MNGLLQRLSSATAMRVFSPTGTVPALSLVMLAALLPAVVVAIIQQGSPWLATMGVSVLVVLVWQVAFALIRRRRIPVDGVATAVIFALLVPSTLPVWQIGLSLSFGIVLGQEVFGGRGYGFLNPATVALAFLLFSFPGVSLTDLQMLNALAVLPGLLLLLVSGIVSWRVLCAAAAGLVAAGLLAGYSTPWLFLLSGGFVFGAVFLVADPVAAPSTNAGRWVYGALFGGLVVLLGGGADGKSLQAVVFAALLASIAAPLIDQGTIHVNAWRRRQRNG